MNNLTNVVSISGTALLVLIHSVIVLAEEDGLGKLFDKAEQVSQTRQDAMQKDKDKYRKDIKEFEQAIEDLRRTVPDPLRKQEVSKGIAKNRADDQLAFNANLERAVDANRGEIASGRPLTSLVKILGPMAGYRKQKIDPKYEKEGFPSLEDSRRISAEETSHFNLSFGKLAGMRLNHRPLDIEWPEVTIEKFADDLEAITRLRDAFREPIFSSAVKEREKRAKAGNDLLDQIELLMAKHHARRSQLAKNVDSLKDREKDDIYRHALAIEHLERFRASVRKFKEAPSTFNLKEFPGGNVEEFLKFCYEEGYSFEKAASPNDEQAYVKLFLKIQAYGRDVQLIEDLKTDYRRRISDLNAKDHALVLLGALK